MTLTQFMLVLRARWRLALGVFGGIVGLTVLASLLMTTLYTATATVVAEVKADPLNTVPGYAMQSATAYVATQVDIISSRRVARRVARIMKFDQSPGYVAAWKAETGGHGDIDAWLADMLQKYLVVTPSRDSSVIEIAATWRDRDTAAALANAFAQAYVETSIELKSDPAKQYAMYFEERAKTLRADLEAKQKRLSDFEAKTGIVATTDARMDIENARLAELSSQLVAIQALRQDSQSRQRQAAGDADFAPEVLQSPVIATLKSELASAEAKLQDIATNLGKNHPDYQQTVAEVANIHTRISQETARIAASLGATTQVNLRKENDIRAALDAQKQKILDLTHRHDEVSVLQSDVETAQRNLDAVTQHLAQSSLESDTQQTNISILTSAVPPRDPSRPRWVLNLAIGIFVGAVFGMGAALIRETRDGRLRDSDEMRRLGAPFLGVIPEIAGGGGGKRSRVVQVGLSGA